MHHEFFGGIIAYITSQNVEHKTHAQSCKTTVPLNFQQYNCVGVKFIHSEIAAASFIMHSRV